jgi:FkbM family methyltransferase
VVYNEIFVHGEYDRALGRALEAAAAHAQPIHIVDLGANVGFFTLRAVQQLLERGLEPGRFVITAVEADAGRVKEFEARIFRENKLSRNVRLTHGLVGKRSGEAELHGDSLFRRELRGVTVPFVDLDSLLSNAPRIDLLKCDIEGAEAELFESSSEWISKVRILAVECHGAFTAERFLDALASNGVTARLIMLERTPQFGCDQVVVGLDNRGG